VTGREGLRFEDLRFQSLRCKCGLAGAIALLTPAGSRAASRGWSENVAGGRAEPVDNERIVYIFHDRPGKGVGPAV
jgi:hypothetical protein